MRCRQVSAGRNHGSVAGMARLAAGSSRYRRPAGRRQAAPKEAAPTDFFTEPCADFVHRLANLQLRMICNSMKGVASQSESAFHATVHHIPMSRVAMFVEL